MGHRQFTDTLIALRYGTLHEDLTKALADLTMACNERGKPGSLTLMLTLKPGKAGQIEVVDDIKLKLPKEEKGSSLMFVSPDGNLQREDPRQLTLDGLRRVDNDTGEIIRTVKGAA